ncbi:ADP-forming succinate--CoA ligase subunit beta [Candidatus Pseudothioglobus singularis]|uniref:Succinate--CoA ligase [ADP-forming] subunit beta n=1 Tax=Candidatus Pseudothioglobus singularis PS1 TaxID=1125411 RepID=A0A0M4LCB2_9GAMM|nr:ADP-forming succinate--CoA ligase subunit beta [Candidatus Pseudothioglobus singularis]ALE01344.1 malate--CoA ligase subunit beta [Candidatus Pseudothioglobus singularis PS1]
MHIHEHQAKDLFKKNGIKVPNFIVVSNATDTESACIKLGGSIWVVKAQVHAGGRGKGGGVIVCKNIKDAIEASESLLGTNLITPQTDANGQPVNEVIIEAGQDIAKELYLGLLVDRASERITVLASTEGGMDIEKVASDTPDKIIKMKTNPLSKLSLDECSEVSVKLGLDESLHDEFSQTLMGLYEIFTTNDANLIEINPLIITGDNQIMALDGKIDFDDNALYRNESILALRDVAQEDEKERSASEYELNYISLDGTVGCMVNGAGLAMATMDLIEYHGGSPANFLDVGGGTTSERVAKAFEIIQSGENVKAILVNIFGGIVRCDLIANGILQAIEKVGLALPIVVRLEGTNAKEGLDILNASNFNIITEADLTQAAKQVVEMAK